ncbi:MAG: hypothetical protein JWM53_5989, partial [bacterium]|nr:hypothetical protein [bacterium]
MEHRAENPISATATIPTLAQVRAKDPGNVCNRCDRPTRAPKLASGRRYCETCVHRILDLLARMRQLGRPW